jgi:hypothetical protein
LSLHNTSRHVFSYGRQLAKGLEHPNSDVKLMVLKFLTSVVNSNNEAAASALINNERSLLNQFPTTALAKRVFKLSEVDRSWIFFLSKLDFENSRY